MTTDQILKTIDEYRKNRILTEEYVVHCYNCKHKKEIKHEYHHHYCDKNQMIVEEGNGLCELEQDWEWDLKGHLNFDVKGDEE